MDDYARVKSKVQLIPALQKNVPPFERDAGGFLPTTGSWERGVVNLHYRAEMN